MNLRCKAHDEGVVIDVRVQPGAKRSAVVGNHDGAIKIAIAAPPTDGKANEELMAFLGKLLNLRKSRIDILRGKNSRDKSVLLRDVTDANLGKLLVMAMESK